MSTAQPMHNMMESHDQREDVLSVQHPLPREAPPNLGQEYMPPSYENQQRVRPPPEYAGNNNNAQRPRAASWHNGADGNYGNHGGHFNQQIVPFTPQDAPAQGIVFDQAKPGFFTKLWPGKSSKSRISVERLQKDSSSLHEFFEKFNEMGKRVTLLSKSNAELTAQLAHKTKIIDKLNRQFENQRQRLVKNNQDVEKYKSEHSRFMRELNELRLELKDTRQHLHNTTVDLDSIRHSASKDREAAELYIADRETVYERTLRDATLEKNRIVETLKATKDREIATLNNQRHSEVSHLRQAHELEVIKLRHEIARLEREHANTIACLERDHTDTIAALKASYQQQTEQLIASHEAGTKELQEDVHTLNATLRSRDDQVYLGEIFTSTLPASPDETLRQQFQDIVQMVDTLSRIEWIPNPFVWTNDVLELVSAVLGDRMVKKAIVQDLVWSILFQFIFATPFRMFGDEGVKLEKQWTTRCSQNPGTTRVSGDSFAWPRASVASERWRYITLKNCRDMLRPPLPSEWDPRLRITKDYAANLSNCRTALITYLENIVELDDTNIAVLTQLCKKASTLWLQFSMHRCRIVVEMSGKTTLSMASKVAAVQSQQLELVTVPAVRRYGNVMGVDLDQNQIVGKLSGESVIVP